MMSACRCVQRLVQLLRTDARCQTDRVALREVERCADGLCITKPELFFTRLYPELPHLFACGDEAEQRQRNRKTGFVKPFGRSIDRERPASARHR